MRITLGIRVEVKHEKIPCRVFFLVASPILADAEALLTLPLDQQEVVAESEKNSGQQKITQVMLVNAAVEMEQECMKAVGNPGFCRCIARETPTSVNFQSYVAMVVGTRADARYDYLSAEGRQVFDATRKARDECVAWRGKR
jgi:hypothetical protein